MGRITQETLFTAKVSIGQVKQVLRSRGTTDRWTCQSLVVASGQIHTLGACLSSAAAATAIGFGLVRRGEELLLLTSSSHPPFLPQMVLSRVYSVHNGFSAPRLVR